MNDAIATATQAVANAAPEILTKTPINTTYVLIASAVCIIVGATVCAIVQGRVIEKIADSIARQPESAGDLRGSMIIGLAMVESLAIYCLLIALLLIFMKS